MTHRRRPALFLILAVTIGACGPPASEDAGLKRYSTDVILGAQTRSTLPPPAPIADIAPGFPSFIAPPPPPAASALPAPVSPTEVTKPAARRACPQAGVNTIPPRVSTEIYAPPAPGVYPYRQTGSFSVGDRKGNLPAIAEHVVKNVVKSSGGTSTYDLEINQLGDITTTSYAIVRSDTSTSTNGLYVTRILRKLTDGSTQDFLPVPPGLRVFVLPAVAATSWSSVATDPVNRTSASLDGVITAPSRVDACGNLVEGWETKAKISITTADTPEAVRSTTIDATYVVVPQLGGLFVSDHVVLNGTEKGIPVRQTTDDIINRLTPSRTVL